MSVAENCSAKGCKVNVPAGLAAEHLCIMHFTLFIENECAEMRRETALGNTNHERQMEFITKISGRGEALREGLRLTILGPPNAGKSSLINALSRRPVAIVSQTPGTTRDVVEARLDLGGYLLMVADTAGVRDTADMIGMK